MKKIHFPRLTILLIIAINSIAYSQNSINSAKPGMTWHEKIILLTDQLNEEKENGPARLNEINAKTARNFMRKFKNATDVKWFISADGRSAVYFTSNGIMTRAFYDKNGNEMFMLRYYTEDKLAYDVRHLVKSNYYDFNICLITEISLDNKTAYIVSIEYKTSWKKIKVADGGMEVMEEYLKG